MLRNIIMGCLTFRDMSGYEIKKMMSYSTSFFSNVSYGGLYPTLKKLEMDQLVESREEVRKGRYQKVYTLTEKGRGQFLEWLEAPLKPLSIKYDMLVRIFFAHNLPREKLISILEEHLEQIRDSGERLKEISKGVGKSSDRYQAYTLRYGLEFNAFLTNWHENLLAELKQEGSDENTPPVAGRS
jgi:DNA-binding PadR family transcriptional regulator